MHDSVAEVGKGAGHAGVAHLATHRDFEPAQPHLFPGSRPAGLTDNRTISRDAMIDHIGHAAAQAVILAHRTAWRHGRHPTPGKGQRQFAHERHAGSAHAAYCLGQRRDHAFGIRCPQANDIAIIGNRGVGQHIGTQLRADPGHIFLRVSLQMGINGRIEHEGGTSATTWQPAHGVP